MSGTEPVGGYGPYRGGPPPSVPARPAVAAAPVVHAGSFPARSAPAPGRSR